MVRRDCARQRDCVDAAALRPALQPRVGQGRVPGPRHTHQPRLGYRRRTG